jgi:CheY-like chemotaxis protein
VRALDGKNRDMPIIAVIDGDADEARDCMDAGADIVLRKPVPVAGVPRAVADPSALERLTVAGRAAA